MCMKDLSYEILKNPLGIFVLKKEAGICLVISSIFMKVSSCEEYEYKFYIVSLINDFILELDILEDTSGWITRIEDCLNNDPVMTIFMDSEYDELRNINEFKLNRKFLKI